MVRTLALLVALLLLPAAITAAAAPRIATSLDRGWRFHLGDTPGAAPLCPADAFATDLSGMYCPGWAHHGAYGLTAAECRLYCCGDPLCAGYLTSGDAFPVSAGQRLVRGDGQPRHHRLRKNGSPW